MGIDNRPYRGNAGGIAIGYDENNDPDHHPNIKISDSVIESNQATGSTNFEREASRLLRQRIFKQRGGGVAFYFGVRSRRASVEILRSSFVNNSAKSAGGGLYISLEGETNSHVINIRDCNFSSNSAYIGAGMVTFYNSANDGSLPPAEILAHTVTLTDSVFIGNSGNYGGAVSNIQLGYLSILNVTNCTFMENNAIVGAALYLQFLLTVHSFVPEKKIIIEDWYIIKNSL